MEHVLSLGFMSIIGKNMTDALPGWSPWCTNCIIPDHAGLGDPKMIDVFHRTSRFSSGPGVELLASLLAQLKPFLLQLSSQQIVLLAVPSEYLVNTLCQPLVTSGHCSGGKLHGLFQWF